MQRKIRSSECGGHDSVSLPAAAYRYQRRPRSGDCCGKTFEDQEGLNEILVVNTGQLYEVTDRQLERDNYMMMNAEEAKALHRLMKLSYSHIY